MSSNASVLNYFNSITHFNFIIHNLVIIYLSDSQVGDQQAFQMQSPSRALRTRQHITKIEIIEG